MNYLSLFSGIEAASVAWQPLGWNPLAFSEIEPFPCELLNQRFPDVPNLGDITKIDWSNYAGTVDVIVGGSPCQSFSIAGNREGLKGESGLMFEYIRAICEVMPRYFVWENVPGALSSEKGASFEQLLREMDDLGYGMAWRVLDAQFFGVSQRRRRVFLIGCLGDAERAAEILFERESLLWDSPTSRKKREELAANVEGSTDGCCLPFNATQITSKANGNNPYWNDPCHTLSASDRPPHVICMAQTQSHAEVDEDMCGTLTRRSFKDAPVVVFNGEKATSPYVARRLTPLECERLQGFPDGWTDIEFKGKPASDTARYKALGNSMAVPVMHWIGERIRRY